MATLDWAPVGPHDAIHESIELPPRTTLQTSEQCRIALQLQWPARGLRVRRFSHGSYGIQDFFDASFLDQVSRSKAVKVLMPRIQPCSRCPWVGIKFRKAFHNIFNVSEEALLTRSGVGTPLLPPGHCLRRGPQHVRHIDCSNGGSASQQLEFPRHDVLFSSYARHGLHPVYWRVTRQDSLNRVAARRSGFRENDTTESCSTAHFLSAAKP